MKKQLSIELSQAQYNALQNHIARHIALIECCNIHAVTIADVVAAKVLDACKTQHPPKDTSNAR